MSPFIDSEWIEKISDPIVAYKVIGTLAESLKDEITFSAVSKAIIPTLNSVEFLSQIKAMKREHPKDAQILIYLLMEFPKVYLENIPWLSFPDWYCVCFTNNISNPALWGYYADGHKGVCLIFKNNPDDGIYLSAMNQELNPRKQLFSIRKVMYGLPPIKVDFFLSLGWLWGDERGHWLTHNGEKSIKLLDMFTDEEQWRTRFYEDNTERFLRKSAAWESEQEYRIAMDDLWVSHTESEHRKFHYDFNDLDGIIFGIKTPLEEKLRIVEIIMKKCVEHRKNFNFYQAMYNAEKDLIELERNTFLGTIEETVNAEY